MELNAEKLIALDFLSPEMRAWISQKLPLLLMVVLVVILAYQIAGISWALLERMLVDEAQVTTQPNVKMQSRQQQKSVDNSYINLANFHLFGQQDVARAVTDVPVTAPETRLNLVLFGVFTDDNSKKGSAIIGQKTGEQKYYSVGEKVDNGVWLAEVRQDHVLLKRGANYEVLKFPKEVTTGVNIASNTRPVGNQNISQEKQTFMDNVKIIPVFTGKDRTLKGYRILPKKNRAVYNRLGIRPTDIVTSINGIALSDQREAMKVIAELVKSDQVEVQLDRNGQIENKVLSLK